MSRVVPCCSITSQPAINHGRYKPEHPAEWNESGESEEREKS